MTSSAMVRSGVALRRKLLETHTWHARRFVMCSRRSVWRRRTTDAMHETAQEEKDNDDDDDDADGVVAYGLAHGQSDARSTSVLTRKSKSRALIHDASYIEIVQLRSEERDALMHVLEMMVLAKEDGEDDDDQCLRVRGDIDAGVMLRCGENADVMIPARLWIHPGACVAWMSVHPSCVAMVTAALERCVRSGTAMAAVEVVRRGDSVRRIVMHGSMQALHKVLRAIGAPDAFDGRRSGEHGGEKGRKTDVQLVAQCIALHPMIRARRAAVAAAARERGLLPVCDTDDDDIEGGIGVDNNDDVDAKLALLGSLRNASGAWLRGTATMLPPPSVGSICALRAKHRRDKLGLPHHGAFVRRQSDRDVATSPGCPLILMLGGSGSMRQLTMHVPQQWVMPFWVACLRDARAIAIGYREHVGLRCVSGAIRGGRMDPRSIFFPSLVMNDTDVRGGGCSATPLLSAGRRRRKKQEKKKKRRREATVKTDHGGDGHAYGDGSEKLQCSVAVVRRGSVREGWQIRAIGYSRARAHNGKVWDEPAHETASRPIIGDVTGVVSMCAGLKVRGLPQASAVSAACSSVVFETEKDAQRSALASDVTCPGRDNAVLALCCSRIPPVPYKKRRCTCIPVYVFPKHAGTGWTL